MNRRLIIILTLGAMFGVAIIPLNPVNSTFFRLALLGSIAGVWAGLLFLLWKRKLFRFSILTALVIFIAPFLLPSQTIDQSELRSTYVDQMIQLEGTKYSWGGESSRGIDCSGLPRRALRKALLSYGLRHADGGSLRMYLEQWWYDASAKALGDGYRDYTARLETVGAIESMDYAGLEPGDLAVTQSGIHVLVYLGDDRWIQADPGIGEVTTLHGRDDRNPWFTVPVTTHRWRTLQQE